jgi:3(or 17)beta-hydroxysteroid dehydrogenase
MIFYKKALDNSGLFYFSVHPHPFFDTTKLSIKKEISMARVKNKIALITGGSRGIGAATAQLLVQEGAQVIITDVRDDEGTRYAQNIGAIYYHLDVSVESDWKKIIDEIKKKWGRLDILFNNAGIIGLDPQLGPQDPEYTTLESWHYVHRINLDGVFLGCKYGISLMKLHGGSIINMSSRSGMVGVPGTAAYASSKAAIRNHTKTVALYCAQKKYNIRCNSIHPAAILTSLWDPMLCSHNKSKDTMITDLAAGIPLGHMGEPLDVAYAVLYLASDESKYMTGAEIVLDGGILAGSAAAAQKSSDSC